MAFSFLTSCLWRVLSQSNHEHFQKGLDFSREALLLCINFQKLIESPTVRQRRRGTYPAPGTTSRGRTALQVLLSSRDLVTARACPGGSRRLGWGILVGSCGSQGHTENICKGIQLGTNLAYLRKSTEATVGLPRWCSGKEPTCQCKRHKFDPWIRKSLE